MSPRLTLGALICKYLVSLRRGAAPWRAEGLVYVYR